MDDGGLMRKKENGSVERGVFFFLQLVYMYYQVLYMIIVFIIINVIREDIILFMCVVIN